MPKKTALKWSPESKDYLQIFQEQNPWHRLNSVPEALAKTRERPLAKFLWHRILRDKPHRFQLILGPRRVGKTTSLYQTVRHLLAEKNIKLWWLRLDHPLLMRMDLGKLVKSLIGVTKADQSNPLYLFLDEITYAKEWDLWLKTFYDDKWPIRIAGSSSATAIMRDRRMESGVGRWDEQYLNPYLFGEYLQLIGSPAQVKVGGNLSETIKMMIEERLPPAGWADHRRRFLLTGGFPELLIDSNSNQKDEASLVLGSQRILRTDAVERAIYKDIPQAFSIQEPILLERVLYALAGQFTGLLSPNHICGNLGGLSQPTFDRYLSYLERTFLVFTLQNYSGSEISKQKRGRKLYFVDGAVRNAALQRGILPLDSAHEMGMLIENSAAGHLHALGQQSQVRIYHWRDGGDEVDLIYDWPEKPLAFEIANSASHHRSGLLALMSRFPRFRNRCYIVAPDADYLAPAKSSDKIGALPLDAFLVAVSAQAELELAERLGASKQLMKHEETQSLLFSDAPKHPAPSLSNDR